MQRKDKVKTSDSARQPQSFSAHVTPSSTAVDLELMSLTAAKTGVTSTLPLISVIVPIYNVEETLEASLNSILAQTYSHLEIICVDDGSTDRSGELCERIARQDPRIHLLHQDNQGLSAARNAGLDIMRGEFVTFVDSDDKIAPDLIESLYRLILEESVKLAICSFMKDFPDGRQENFAKDFANLGSDHPDLWLFSTEECLTSMLCENGFTMSAWGKLYHASLFKHVRFPVGKLYEDVGTTYKTVLECEKIAFLALPKYFYAQNPRSITKQTFSMRKLDLIDLTDSMCQDLDQRYPSLENLTKKRRMHARFSILRQMGNSANPHQSADSTQTLDTHDFYAVRKQIVKYLRKHKNYILNNPLASQRDRTAIALLLLGRPLFQAAWGLYSRTPFLPGTGTRLCM